MRCVWLMLLVVQCSPAAAQIASVNMHGPARDFGHFVGDMLTSTAVITVMPGTVLDVGSLPPLGPASPIADIRQSVVAGTPDRIEIRVTYQEFFSPDQVAQAEIPGYRVAFLANGARLTASVPGFAFTASPFRHDLQPTLDPAMMQPDHPAMAVQAPHAQWLVAAGLMLMLAGLFAITQPWTRTRRRRPFAAAAAQMSRMRGGQGGDADREMIRALHRAFDATAGRQVFADDIDDFLLQHPRLSPQRARIGRFFAASRSVFFGEGGEATDAAAWRDLCRDLARAERRG